LADTLMTVGMANTTPWRSSGVDHGTTIFGMLIMVQQQHGPRVGRAWGMHIKAAVFQGRSASITPAVTAHLSAPSNWTITPGVVHRFMQVAILCRRSALGVCTERVGG
jgi:hypothetical protein